MDKDQLKNLRAPAVTLKLHLDDGDSIKEMSSRGSVSRLKIKRFLAG